MNIKKISADREKITIHLDSTEKTKLNVSFYDPSLGHEKLLYSSVLSFADGKADIERISENGDLIYSRIEAETIDKAPVSGIKYVDEITGSKRDFDYPTASTKKGLQICYNIAEEVENLGVKHAALNVNVGNFIMENYEEGNTIEFEYDGKVYYINKKVTEANDERNLVLNRHGVIITYILLNSRRWGSIKASDSLWEKIKHPCYSTEGHISQFNVIDAEGLAYYRAFVAFLSERYTREDEKYGKVVGMIVGNEVNSGYVWCNAGEMTCEQYSREYTTALRVTWQVAAQYYSNMRIYISADHFWNGGMSIEQPMRYYGTKQLLQNINNICTEEGNIPWNMAHHPYPEDLHFPDFWNDTTATLDENTRRITFKNLEVLAQILYKTEYLYHGERRRIILSEQGFNSHFTPESEVLQAMAYGKAYKKVMSIPEIDSFILHAHKDNMYEEGLSLGLVRRKRDSNEPDGFKPAYYVFKAIDQKDEKGVYHWERY